jgi:hypothetical protein
MDVGVVMFGLGFQFLPRFGAVLGEVGVSTATARTGREIALALPAVADVDLHGSVHLVVELGDIDCIGAQLQPLSTLDHVSSGSTDSGADGTNEEEAFLLQSPNWDVEVVPELPIESALLPEPDIHDVVGFPIGAALRTAKALGKPQGDVDDAVDARSNDVGATTESASRAIQQLVRIAVLGADTSNATRALEL